MGALAAFGAPLDDLTVEDLATAETLFIMGRPPNQIDIITAIDDVSFERPWPNRYQTTYGGVRVNYIGREDLITNRESAGRPQDLLDVAYLRGARNDRSPPESMRNVRSGSGLDGYG